MAPITSFSVEGNAFQALEITSMCMYLMAGTPCTIYTLMPISSPLPVGLYQIAGYDAEDNLVWTDELKIIHPSHV